MVRKSRSDSYEGRTEPLQELCLSITDCHHSTPKWTESGYLVIRNYNIRKGTLVLDDASYTDEETFHERIARAKPEPGDLVISREAPMGQVAMIPEGVECCLGQRMVLIKPDPRKVDARYLLFAMQSEFVQKQIGVSDRTGSTVSNLRIPLLKELAIPVFDKDVERHIASVLSALDDKIALNTRINAELEAMAKLLYDYWFVQFDFPNAKGKPYKSSGGAMVYNAELKREVPEGWEVTELRKYIGSNRGHSYTGADIGGEGLPMINLNSFNTSSTYKVEGLKMYSGVLNPAKILEPFDLVMCNTQQTALDPVKDIIGKSLLVPDIFDKEMVSSHHVTTINVKKDGLKYYLNSLFNTEYFHRYISGYCSGTNILGLNFEGVLSFQTAIPPDELIKRFGATVQSIEQRKSISLKENQELTTLRDWLLPLLMNGQVVVGEAAEKVGLAMAAEPAGKYERRKGK